LSFRSLLFPPHPAMFLHLFSPFPQIRPKFPALRQPFYFETGLSRGSNEIGQREICLDHTKVNVFDRNS
jgi:hypothetical protein